MKVISSGIKNGIIDDKFGKKGQQFNENGMPNYSLPLTISDAPKGTVSFAIVLEDKDAYPVTKGFSWIHWLVANLSRHELQENESISATDFVQGCNSWASLQGGEQSVALSSFYGGMAPPDAPHIYEIHVYALDTMLNLQTGFMMNELYKQMDSHILASYTLKGRYAS